MPFKFNPLTGMLDLVTSTKTDVVGPSSADDNAIARYDGTSGKLIQNSKAFIQDGGAIEAQALLTNRVINELVQIKSNFTMLTPNIEIEDGELVIEADGELLIL